METVLSLQYWNKGNYLCCCIIACSDFLVCRSSSFSKSISNISHWGWSLAPFVVSFLCLFLLGSLLSAPWRRWNRHRAPFLRGSYIHAGWGPSESTKHECFTAFWSQANLYCLPPVSSCLNKNESGVLLQAQRGLGGMRSAEQRCAGMHTLGIARQNSPMLLYSPA